MVTVDAHPISVHANGMQALLKNTIGYYNTATGSDALFHNTTAINNTAIGRGALFNTTTGNNNTGLGYGAGQTYVNGANNVFVGANSDVNANDYYNVIAIGESTTVTGVSTARLGNTATVSTGGWTNWSNVSDGRYKQNVKEDVQGLAFIMKLRPVTYQLMASALSEKLNERRGEPMNAQMKLALTEKEKVTYTGFIAQEVEKAAKELDYDFSGVETPKDENDFYALRYAEFVVPLVKAVQEQQIIIEEQNQKIEFLLQEIQLIKNRLP